ncbi:MAG: ankyrin repeat domain-containing protein [Alphaproteobacteria bacterium]|nr:ankyrin repeat domain-containing protein [Alphaproteobacteria bacterium]
MKQLIVVSMHLIIQYVAKFLAVISLIALFASSALALDKQDEDLIYEANFGEPATVEALLKAGANPNAIGEDKWPVISLASMRADQKAFDTVKLLVEAGADLNVRDPNGETPLMNAISINNPDMVKYMIEEGADFHAVNANGRNVKLFAEHYGNEDVVFLIEEALRLEKKRMRDGRSRKRMYKKLDDYIYYNCAMQYISYNQAVGIYPKSQSGKTERLLADVVAKIGNAQMDLMYDFRMEERALTKIAKDTQNLIFGDLEALISNRNRMKYGVGKDSDLDKRCKEILEKWRVAYQQYENQDTHKE